MSNKLWDDLVPFTEGRTRGGDVCITISAKQSIVFNKAFVKVAELDKFDSVVLYYSKNNNAIIFKFINRQNGEDKEKGAMKISRGINASISARSFFNHYNFGKDFNGKFEPKKEEIKDIGSVWAIYLQDPINS